MFYTFEKKKYKRSRNSFCHRGQTPDKRTTIIYSSKEISWRQSTAIASEQASICLDSSSYAFKIVRPTLLIMMVSKKTFKSKTVTSDQTDSCKTS